MVAREGHAGQAAAEGAQEAVFWGDPEEVVARRVSDCALVQEVEEEVVCLPGRCELDVPGAVPDPF